MTTLEKALNLRERIKADEDLLRFMKYRLTILIRRMNPDEMLEYAKRTNGI